jgi:hypothetical protein
VTWCATGANLASSAAQSPHRVRSCRVTAYLSTPGVRRESIGSRGALCDLGSHAVCARHSELLNTGSRQAVRKLHYGFPVSIRQSAIYIGSGMSGLRCSSSSPVNGGASGNVTSSSKISGKSEAGDLLISGDGLSPGSWASYLAQPLFFGRRTIVRLTICTTDHAPVHRWSKGQAQNSSSLTSSSACLFRGRCTPNP